MTKACYTGVGGVAKKVKSIYVGVNGVARKVKYGYVGVGGVARQFFSAEQKLVKGVAANLERDRAYLAAASNGSFALFGGGNHAYVEAYSPTLVRWVQEGLTAASAHLTAARAGNYAVFGGGDSRGKWVDAYSQSLVKSTNSSALSVVRHSVTAATTGGFAIFAGGCTQAYSSGSGVYYSVAVDAIGPTLTSTTLSGLCVARGKVCGGSVGDYALFAGGDVRDSNGYPEKSAYVDAYSSSLVRTSVASTSRSTTNEWALAVTVGGTALLIHGNMDDAYSPTLVKTAISNNANWNTFLAGASLGDFAIIGGGTPYYSSTSDTSSDVATYSTALVKSTIESLSVGRYNLAAVSIGDYALFGGGQPDASTFSAVVDTYHLE